MLCVTWRHPLDCGVLCIALQQLHVCQNKNEVMLYKCDSGWPFLVVKCSLKFLCALLNNILWMYREWSIAIPFVTSALTTVECSASHVSQFTCASHCIGACRPQSHSAFCRACIRICERNFTFFFQCHLELVYICWVPKNVHGDHHTGVRILRK